ncbi:MAG TPA: hypothetical protein VFO55_02315 [Gemmatimonadaceae bacterium]|nr:hypothetical protein [Gemmatimonadaceae bacterium]
MILLRSKVSLRPVLGILFLVTLAMARPVGAQDTARARLDSLAEALRLAQARLDALEQKVGEATENGVHTRSGTRMELTGRVILQAFGNSGRVNNVDNPQFARADAAVPERGGGMSMRQTLLAFRVSSPDVAGAQFAGDLSTDFYGGQLPSSGGRTFPLIRLRVAKAMLRWSNSELMVGQDVPLIAQLNPVSIAASGTPLFATAGNLWLWLPQARVTLGGFRPNTAAIQLAVLAPTSGDPANTFDTDLDLAERTSRPFVETRLRFRWEMSERPGEIGCGAHVGWILDAATRSEAVACDLVAPLWMTELRAEAYTGQALKGLGGGGIGQSLTTTQQPVVGVGGWAQLNVNPSPIWGFGVGCGVDDPDDFELAPAGRLRNASCGAHFVTHPSGPLLLSLEVRRLVTTYASGQFRVDHLNLGFGFEF